mmetsp:Transcript_2842/g.8926  ORF Transcript_2842/g.8926 Transcript_2842/m.8926 type:complete len:232 (-) Transcript_2842:544-1239(-)
MPASPRRWRAASRRGTTQRACATAPCPSMRRAAAPAVWPSSGPRPRWCSSGTWCGRRRSSGRGGPWTLWRLRRGTGQRPPRGPTACRFASRWSPPGEVPRNSSRSLCWSAPRRVRGCGAPTAASSTCAAALAPTISSRSACGGVGPRQVMLAGERRSCPRALPLLATTVLGRRTSTAHRCGSWKRWNATCGPTWSAGGRPPRRARSAPPPRCRRWLSLVIAGLGSGASSRL